MGHANLQLNTLLPERMPDPSYNFQAKMRELRSAVTRMVHKKRGQTGDPDPDENLEQYALHNPALHNPALLYAYLFLRVNLMLHGIIRTHQPTKTKLT